MHCASPELLGHVRLHEGSVHYEVQSSTYSVLYPLQEGLHQHKTCISSPAKQQNSVDYELQGSAYSILYPLHEGLHQHQAGISSTATRQHTSAGALSKTVTEPFTVEQPATQTASVTAPAHACGLFADQVPLMIKGLHHWKQQTLLLS